MNFQRKSRLLKMCVLIVGVTGTLGVFEGRADPPPPTTFPIPMVFCFRITDINRVPGDPEGDRFNFEFEVLNWTNTESFDLYISRNTGTGFGVVQQARPFFAGAIVDPNGRPIGGGDDDANFPPADGETGTKVGRANSWGVILQTNNSVRYAEPTGMAGNGMPGRDLLGSGSSAAACNLVPGCIMVGGVPTLPSIETVDNGAPGVDGGPDNVLDGYVIDVDDFDPGEMLSFNWFLTDAAGNSIGVSGMGNAFAFGSFNIFRVNSDGPAVWQRSAGAPEGPGRNVGTTNNLRDMFVDSTPEGEAFQVELGNITGEFDDPAANILDAPINGELLPDVPAVTEWGLIAMTVLLLTAGTIVVGRRRRRARA